MRDALSSHIELFSTRLFLRQDDGYHSMLFREAIRHETLTFDLHPLYASILQDGSTVREGEVLGLDGDLRRVMIAPFDGVIRLLVTGEGRDRRVKVFLSEQISSRR